MDEINEKLTEIEVRLAELHESQQVLKELLTEILANIQKRQEQADSSPKNLTEFQKVMAARGK